MKKLFEFNDRKRQYFLFKVMLTYTVLFVLTAFVIFQYNYASHYWTKYLLLMMWGSSALAVHFIPEDRENIIKETRWAVIGYLFYLLFYHFFQSELHSIGQYNLNRGMDPSSYSALQSFLSTMPLMIELLFPVGFVIWMGQKFKILRGRKKKDEKFSELKGNKNFK